MNVADFNAAGKSVSSNCGSMQEIRKTIRDMGDELTKSVQMAVGKGDSFDFVERKVRDSLLEMGIFTLVIAS